MKNNPEFASNVGDQRYTDQLEDYSLEAFQSRKVSVQFHTCILAFDIDQNYIYFFSDVKEIVGIISLRGEDFAPFSAVNIHKN